MPRRPTTRSPAGMPDRLRWVIALAAACCVTAVAHAEPQRLTLTGTVQTTGEPREATLRIVCDPGPDGVLGLELWVPKAFELKDFDYDDFEGPDAAARTRLLSSLVLQSTAGSTRNAFAVTGWYAGDDPNTFVFGVSGAPYSYSGVAAIFRDVASDRDELVWSQRSFRKPERTLRAAFPLDVATGTRLRATVGPCLATARKASPPKKTP